MGCTVHRYGRSSLGLGNADIVYQLIAGRAAVDRVTS